MASRMILAFALTLALSAPAAGQAPDNTRLCRGNDLDVRLRACGAIVEDGGADERARREAHYYRGKAHDGKGDYDRAIKDFDESIRLDDQATAAALTFGARGMAYMAKGQHERALEDFEEAVRRTSSNPAFGAYSLYERGLLHLARGQYDRAIEDFDRAFVNDPNPTNWEARYARGVARQRKGDRAAGAADIAAVKAEFGSAERLRKLAAEWTKRGVKP